MRCSMASVGRGGRDVIGGQGRPGAKEETVHRLDEELLGFPVAEVEPVLVHNHLHAVHPHLPGLLGNVVVDLLPKRMAIERHFVEALHFALDLHTEHLVGALRNRLIHNVESPQTRILRGEEGARRTERPEESGRGRHECLRYGAGAGAGGKPTPVSTMPNSRLSPGAKNVWSTAISTMAPAPAARTGGDSNVYVPGAA